MDAIRIHHQLVWGGHQWPADASLAISHRQVGGKYMTTKRVPVKDENAFVTTIAEKASKGEVWVNVAPQPITTERRGGKKAAIALPALFADVDIDTGEHKALDKPLPTAAEALEIISKCPLQPTLLIHTGGGYHVWVALDTPLDYRTPEGEELLKRWKAWWVAAFVEAGRHLDEGVLADVARMLRIAGTANHKRPEDVRPVTMVGEPGEPVSIATALDSLPPLPVKPASSATAPKLATQRQKGDDNRPGSLLRHTVPVSALLEPVLGLERMREVDGGFRWRAPASVAGDGDAQTYPGDDGVETVTIFCDMLAASLGMEAAHRTWDSWGLLIHQCGGDAHLAARVARQCPDAQSLIAALTTHTSAEALSEAFPEHIDVGEITVSVPEAIASMSGNVIRVGSTTHVEIGGHNHGLYATRVAKLKGEEQIHEEQLTDWIAWRPEVVKHLRINDRCQPEVVGEEEYVCEVVTATGRRCTRPGFSAKDSTSARTVIDACNAGVELPVSRNQVTMADNMLRVLGHDDQVQSAIYSSMGWCYIDGMPVYLAPYGSITPDGVTDRYRVSAFDGDDAGLTATMRRIGFAEATASITDAAEAVRLFCGIAPHRPELAIALIGLVFSAPLRLGTRGVPVLTGETDSGKTLLAAAVQTFYADVPLPAKDSVTLSIPQSSPVGAAGVTAWCRDGIAVCDDYRRDGGNKLANEKAAQVLATIVQAAYGSAAGAKATQTGGMRESRQQASSVLVTAEVSAADAAIRNRGITIPLSQADGIGNRGGIVDAFIECANRSVGRSLTAHYLTWLAKRAAKHKDGLERLARVMNARARRHYASLASSAGGRASETVATLATGWETFREFAVEVGIESYLPPQKRVDAALRSLASINATLAAETDPGRQVLDQMAAMLAGNTAHLVSHEGKRPMMDGCSLGWVETTTYGTTTSTRHDPRGPMLGTLSADGRHVVIGKAGVQAAMLGARVDGLAPKQVYDALAKLTVEGTNPGGHCPTSLGIKSRPEGFVIPITLLGLGFAEVEDEMELEAELALALAEERERF